MVIAPDGTLYVADPVRHEIRAVSTSGATRVVAGLGTGQAGFQGDNVAADSTTLHTPMGLCREPLTGAIVVADSGNDRIRLFTRGGRIYTLAGGGSTPTETVTNPLAARLTKPYAIVADGNGKFTFTERTSGRVRQFGATGSLTTLATLPARTVGPLAARYDGQRVWVGAGEVVRLLKPGASPALDPTPVATFTGAEVTGLAYDQAGGLFVSTSTPGTGGRAGARVFRLAVGDDGLMAAGRVPEGVAGTGGTSTDDTAYSAPLNAPDATAVLLGGAWHGLLAIDLTFASDPTRLAGQLYLGSSLDDGAVRFGQVVKLTPRE
jgi:hypothetical protein